jgi:hypothetical protein
MRKRQTDWKEYEGNHNFFIKTMQNDKITKYNKEKRIPNRSNT